MCGRYTLHSEMNLLLQQFAAEARGVDYLSPRYNIAPTQKVPVIRQADGERELSMMRWGLVAPWVVDPDKVKPLNCARSEEIAKTPTFRNIIKNRRCLIVADGFYEWEKTGKDGKVKVPHYYGTRGFRPFAFAGLWQVWHHGELPLESCTIVTTSANELLGKIHTRMPVILSPNDYDVWLDPGKQDPSELTYLYEPYPAVDMESYVVDREVNKTMKDKRVPNEGPHLIEPLSESSSAQGSLFDSDGPEENSE